MKQYFIYILLILLGIIFGFVLGRNNNNAMPFEKVLPLSCTYKGVAYKDGEGFSDDCNSCSCQNGEVNCTAMACDAEIPEAN